MVTSNDPLAPLVELDGVAVAAERARDALAAAHRHPVNVRGWAESSTEASWRAARSSAAIDGADASLQRDADAADPLVAGAVRVNAALAGESLAAMVAVWSRAPLQALARMHLLAASDLGLTDEEVGRPRSDATIAPRLDLLARLATGQTSVPGPIFAAVVHGELLALTPFAAANGVVARAVVRLVGAASGLDPHGLGVPEVTWLRRRSDYFSAAQGFAIGTPEGVAKWLIFHCEAMEAGAAEARSIADARR